MKEEKYTRITITVTGTQSGKRTVISGLSRIVVRGPLRPESNVSPLESPVLLVWYGRRRERLVETVHNLHEEEIAKRSSSPVG